MFLLSISPKVPAVELGFVGSHSCAIAGRGVPPGEKKLRHKIRERGHMYGGGSGAKSCPTLCDLVDCSPPGFSVRGISQARILEWGAICSRGDLPYPGIEPTSDCRQTPALQADSVLTELPGKPLDMCIPVVDSC